MDTELMDKGLKVQMMVQAITEKGIAADKCEAEGNPDEAAKLRAEIDAERKIQLAAAVSAPSRLVRGVAPRPCACAMMRARCPGSYHAWRRGGMRQLTRHRSRSVLGV